MIAHETHGNVLVTYVGRNGGPNITKTYHDYFELRADSLSTTPIGELVMHFTSRLQAVDVASLGFLEQNIQRELDRRAKQRVMTSNL